MKQLKSTYNPKESEEQIQRWWLENRIQKKVMDLRRDGELFAFLEGPPTANGFMHIGHARGRAMKDAIIKFEAMRGRDVWRRAGWDCQGLPVELEVEKRMKLTSKRDIEKVGFDRFVEECNKLVDYYIEHWRRNSERLGLWLNYDEAYETRRDAYIEFVWWFIKQTFDKGLLKEDFKVVPHCPRCETALSSHEVSLGYATFKDYSIYVKFPLQGKPNEFILIWTTTPWTIPADEAVSVHPEYDYAKVKVGDETWIIADELVAKVMDQLAIEYQKVGVVSGSELEGLKYIHPLIDEVPIHKDHKGKYEHAVICGEHVTLDEGTGCVHTAPAHGPEDFDIGNKYNLPVFCPVDHTGRFTENGGKYQGKFFKDANLEIIEDLKRKKILAWVGEIEHEYPGCWRCGSPLLYRVDKHWFLSVKPIREQAISENKTVEWIPEWAGSERFGEWLANAEDWCISRSRFWGTPLNIWRCQSCQSVRVVGTREELRKTAKKLSARPELHRPWIDEVILRCDKCGGNMFRTPFVLDCWLDSGVAHAASVGYLHDPSLFKKLFPYRFITEAVDQTRGWFYSLMMTSVLLFGKAPYRRVLCQGHVLDKHGQKMSKSRGNVVWAEDALNDYGADILRTYLLWKVAPEDTLLYDKEELEQVRRTLTIIRNIFIFSTTYMLLDGFNPEAWPLKNIEKHLRAEDRWLLSRCQNVVKMVTTGLESLRLHKTLRGLLEFGVEDISRFYIRIVRRRTWTEAQEMDKFAVYATLYTALTTLLKLLAPFTPHLAEELYQTFTKGDPTSIHLCEWDVPDERLVDQTLEKDFEICGSLMKAVLSARQRGGVKLRWPIIKMTISPSNREVEEALSRQRKMIGNQSNVKNLETLKAGEKPPFLNVKVNLNMPTLGRRLKSAASRVAAKVSDMDEASLVKAIRNGAPVEVSVGKEKFRLDAEDFTLEEVLPEYMFKENFAYGSVFVDTTKTPELMAEALAKEIVRRAQIMRKEMELKIEEYVNASISCENVESVNLLKSMQQYLRTEVRIKNLEIARRLDVRPRSEKAYSKEWEIEGERVVITIEKL